MDASSLSSRRGGKSLGLGAMCWGAGESVGSVKREGTINLWAWEEVKMWEMIKREGAINLWATLCVALYFF